MYECIYCIEVNVSLIIFDIFYFCELLTRHVAQSKVSDSLKMTSQRNTSHMK